MGSWAADPCGWGLLVLLPSAQRCSVPEAEVQDDKSRAVIVAVAIMTMLRLLTESGDSDNEIGRIETVLLGNLRI